MKHKHHIIPRHLGGSDDPDNLVTLSIEEHAEAHRLLYEEHGRWQDRVAWRGLSGLIGHEEAMREMYDARKGPGNPFYGKKHSTETKKRISDNRRGKGVGLKQSPEWVEKRKLYGERNARYGQTPWNKGKVCGPQSAETRRKKGRPLIYDEVEYNSISEAEKITGISAFKIKKSCSFINL